MKTYILTENQLNKVIDSLILEQVIETPNKEVLKENREIFKIRDLAKILSHQFGEDSEFYYNTILDMLSNAYRKNGDDEVLKLFKDGSGFEIEPMGHGRYIVK